MREQRAFYVSPAQREQQGAYHLGIPSPAGNENNGGWRHRELGGAAEASHARKLPIAYPPTLLEHSVPGSSQNVLLGLLRFALNERVWCVFANTQASRSSLS